MTEIESGGLLAEYPDVLRGAEVAEILRLGVSTVQRRARSGQLPAFRAGTGERAEWRYEKRRIAALIEGGDAWALLPSLLSGQPPVMTPEEVARVFRYDHATVAAMAATGALPGAFKVGGGGRAPWRFYTDKLATLINTGSGAGPSVT
ncbi:helix-turn-helix domain-containing protein [Streptomyces sp. NPDC005900]|uniref:helix-turn-helix domain-containing protein n=1 Tax=Streptomyces sp. NPDC005900 TaxID=3154569 RepID=UPI0033EC788B